LKDPHLTAGGGRLLNAFVKESLGCRPSHADTAVIRIPVEMSSITPSELLSLLSLAVNAGLVDVGIPVGITLRETEEGVEVVVER
jgi:hypothetical protein